MGTPREAPIPSTRATLEEDLERAPDAAARLGALLALARWTCYREPGTSERAAREALASAEAVGDRHAAGEAERLLLHALHERGEHVEVVARAAASREAALGPGGDPTQAPYFAWALAAAGNYAGDSLRAVAQLGDVIADAERYGDLVTLAEATNTLANVHLTMRDPEGALRLHREASDLASRAREPVLAALVGHNEAWDELELADRHEALRQRRDAREARERALAVLDAMEARAEALEAPLLVAHCASARSQALLQLGDLVAAEAELGRAIGVGAGVAGPALALEARLHGVEIHLRAGRARRAARQLAPIAREAHRLGLLNEEARAENLRAQAYEALGDYRAALRAFRRHHAIDARRRAEDADKRVRILAVVLDTERARRDARVDAVTELPNRRAFEEAIVGLGARSGDARIAVAVLDIDRFKDINDAWSHGLGDCVLRDVGAILARQVRAGDIAARIGGEEFALLLVGADDVAASAICERARREVERHPWDALAVGLRVTVSAGWACSARAVDEDARRALVADADRSLYAAKRAGRNRVHGPGGAGRVA